MFNYSTAERMTLGMAVVGAVLLVIGAFLPVWTFLGENLTLMDGSDGAGDGILFIGLTIFALPLAVFKRFRWLAIPGALALLLTFAKYADLTSVGIGDVQILPFIALGLGSLLVIGASVKAFMDRRSAKSVAATAA